MMTSSTTEQAGTDEKLTRRTTTLSIIPGVLFLASMLLQGCGGEATRKTLEDGSLMFTLEDSALRLHLYISLGCLVAALAIPPMMLIRRRIVKVAGWLLIFILLGVSVWNGFTHWSQDGFTLHVTTTRINANIEGEGEVHVAWQDVMLVRVRAIIPWVQQLRSRVPGTFRRLEFLDMQGVVRLSLPVSAFSRTSMEEIMDVAQRKGIKIGELPPKPLL
jgi:hypothetical protein